MVRGRWRPCVIFVYYVLAVVLVEQILISTVHRQQLPPADNATTDRNNTPLVVDAHRTKALRTTTTTILPTSTTTSLVSSISPVARAVTKPVVRPSVSLSKEQQEDIFYRRRAQPVNHYLHRVLLEPKQLCLPNTTMIILVHSHHPHTDRRRAIRSTWGQAVRTAIWPNERRNRSCAGLQLAFVFGRHRDPGLNDLIYEELHHYDDVIQGDFVDSYQNMTLKSLLGLKVVDERCPNVSYLLKTDDDMVVNLPYLLQLLANKTLQRSIMGPLNVGSRVYRQGKWKLSKDEFPFDVFPPYESGSAYVITGDLIHELYVTAEYVPYIHVDDVYITGILGRILGVNHVQQKGFAFWTSSPPTACQMLMDEVVTGTKMLPQNLFALWDNFQKNINCSQSVNFIFNLQ